MKNDERDENSPVEMIEGRLKRLRTNEIDGRKRLKLREEKGVGGPEKQRELGTGNRWIRENTSWNIWGKNAKASHEWDRYSIMDSGSEKKRGGRVEKKQLRIELKDEEARVNLTRNAPDEKSWGSTTGKPTAWS